MAEKQIDAEDGDGKMALWSIGEAVKTLGAGTPTPRTWQLLKAKANLKIGSANALGEVQSLTQSMMRDNSQDAEAIVLAGSSTLSKGREAKTREERLRASRRPFPTSAGSGPRQFPRPQLLTDNEEAGQSADICQ